MSGFCEPIAIGRLDGVVIIFHAQVLERGLVLGAHPRNSKLFARLVFESCFAPIVNCFVLRLIEVDGISQRLHETNLAGGLPPTFDRAKWDGLGSIAAAVTNGD